MPRQDAGAGALAVDASTDARHDDGGLHVEALIGPAGGRVASGDGKAVVEIPPNALAKDTTITIDRADPAPPGAVSPVYEFGPEGLTFAEAISVSIDVPESEQEGDFRVLRIATFSSNVWQTLPSEWIEYERPSVGGLTSHFSPYALVPGKTGNSRNIGPLRSHNITRFPGRDGTEPSWDAGDRRVDGADGESRRPDHLSRDVKRRGPSSPTPAASRELNRRESRARCRAGSCLELPDRRGSPREAPEGASR